MTKAITLKPIAATACIVWGNDSMQEYLKACDFSGVQPSQEGFHEWCCNELDHYGSSLVEDFEVLEDPEGEPITLEIDG